jgi:hypothetical protein
MVDHPLLGTAEEQKVIDTFHKHFKSTGSVSVDDQLRINVDGMVNAKRGQLFPDGRLPVKFGTVTGGFFVDGTGLTSFEGSPRTIKKSAWFFHNPLTSLDGAPDVVDGYFNITGTQIKSLEGLPSVITALALSYDRHMPLLRALVASSVEWPSPTTAPKEVIRIIDKYAGLGKKGILGAGVELTKAGYKLNARW